MINIVRVFSIRVMKYIGNNDIFICLVDGFFG